MIRTWMVWAVWGIVSAIVTSGVTYLIAPEAGKIIFVMWLGCGMFMGTLCTLFWLAEYKGAKQIAEMLNEKIHSYATRLDDTGASTTGDRASQPGSSSHMER